MDWEPTPRVARTRFYRNAWTNKLAVEGRCFNCFHKEHVAASCPHDKAAVPERFRHLLKEAPPMQARVAQPAPALVWDDDENGEAEQDFQ